ncbi:MAG: DJ-1/PfpI family protein [Planctomycetota bacterium]
MKRVLVILPNGFELLEGAAFIDVLGWANECGEEPIEIVTAGVSPEIRCTFGTFVIQPDTVLANISASDFDAVAIPGGFETEGFYEEAFSDSVLKTIVEFNENDKPVASICVGALPLGKSGILNGRRATTYHLSEGKRRNQLAEMGVDVVDEAIVIDKNVITSTSPATAVGVALTLVEKLSSKKNADHVRHEMGFK